MPEQNNLVRFTGYSLLSVTSILLCFFTHRMETNWVFIYVSLSFLGLGLIYWGTRKISRFGVFLFMAIALRFILTFSIPNLSDDFPRFIWDASMIEQDLSPFQYTPHQFDSIRGPEAIDNQAFLLDSMNSVNYYSIYPPVLQSGFYFTKSISGDSIRLNVYWLKFLIFIAETGTLILLFILFRKLKIPDRNWILYAFNPLILLEFCGNMHFEAFMIFFLVLSFYLIFLEKIKLGAVAFAFAVCSKLLPLMFLPLIWRKLGLKIGFQFCLIVGLTVIIMFVPFINWELIANFGDSVDLYFRKFEFNAGIFYVLRWIGFEIYGHNLISILGVALSLIALCMILLISLKNVSERNLFEKLTLILATYFLCSTIVHPWYVSGVLLLSLFTNFKFGLIWSALVFLSYYAYKDTTYTESMLLIGIEYSIVITYMIWEIFRNRNSQTIQ